MTPASFWCTRMMGVAPIRSMARVRLARSEKPHVAVLALQPHAVRTRRGQAFQVVGAAIPPGRKAQGVPALA